MAIKFHSINECIEKLKPAYERIYFSSQKLHESSNNINQIFVSLKKFLVGT